MKHFKKSLAMALFIFGMFLYTLIATMPKTGVLDSPSVIVETLDPSLEGFAPLWKVEVGRRFSNAIVLLVHGVDFVQGEWIVGASIAPHHVMRIQDVVKEYQHRYPNRTMIVLACNTGHLHLGIPGVYYSHSSVWCIPDRGLTPDMFKEAGVTLDGEAQSRWQAESDIVGNIFEFTVD